MRPDASRLGANVGFGYLTDDDDDDAAGGGTSDLFDALFASYDTTRNTGQSSTFTLAISANSAQTNGVVVVTITEPSASAVSPSTVSLDGWSQTGWSHTGTTWTNTLTKASVSSGTTGPSFSFTSSAVGTVTLSTASTAPHTDEATGGGQSVNVTIGAAASFSALPGLVSASLPGNFKVDITCGGEDQTNGYVFLVMYTRATPTFGTVDLDGWSESGWASGPTGGLPALFDGVPWYYNTLTRTNVPVGTYDPTFSVTIDPLHSGFAYDIRTYWTTGATIVPHTDQVAEGGAGQLVSGFA